MIIVVFQSVRGTLDTIPLCLFIESQRIPTLERSEFQKLEEMKVIFSRLQTIPEYVPSIFRRKTSCPLTMQDVDF